MDFFGLNGAAPATGVLTGPGGAQETDDAKGDAQMPVDRCEEP
jgi:hypothetical protein